MPNSAKQSTAHLRPRRIPLSKADREFVYRRDKGVCQHCYEAVPRYAYDIDHIKRSVGGGTGLPSNLVLAHQTCNRRRGKRSLAEWRTVLKAEKEAEKNSPNPLLERGTCGITMPPHLTPNEVRK